MNIKLEYIIYEFKKMLADPLMRFMLVYPLVFGLIGRFIIPLLEENSNMDFSKFEDIIIVALTLMTPLVYGAIIGFSLLEDRDDGIFNSLRVSPLSIHEYIWFKFTVVFIVTVFACIFVMWFSNIGNLSIINIVFLSIVIALSAPFTGLLINAFASNKIEGFAIMKGTGIILLFPIASLFYTDYKEFFFAFAPGFWPAKAISAIIRGNELMNLNYVLYLLIGFVYIVLLNVLAYKLFLKKIQV